MNFPVRAEIYGGAIAVAAGLMLGGAMHPDLAGDDRAAGPQIIAGTAGLRSDGAYGGATLVNYGATPPDYVVGTDAQRAMTWTPERAATSEPQPRYQRAEVTEDDLPALSHSAYTAYDDPPRTHYYPSLGATRRDDADDDEASDPAD